MLANNLNRINSEFDKHNGDTEATLDNYIDSMPEDATVESETARLEELGIVKELTGRKRNRLYAY